VNALQSKKVSDPMTAVRSAKVYLNTNFDKEKKLSKKRVFISNHLFWGIFAKKNPLNAREIWQSCLHFIRQILISLLCLSFYKVKVLKYLINVNCKSASFYEI